MNSTSLSPEMAANAARIKELYYIGMSYPVLTVCTLGIIGNFLSLLTLNKHRKFTAVMFMYVRWMAWSDLMAMVLLIPEVLSVVIPEIKKSNSIVAATYFAHVSLPLVNSFMGSSSLLVVLMTVERYLSICHPLKAHHLSTPARARLCILAVYVVSVVIYIPMIFEMEVAYENSTGSPVPLPVYSREYAYGFWYRHFYSWFRAAVIRFVPFIVIAVLTFLTVKGYRAIVHRRRALKSKPGSTSSGSSADDRNLIIILVVTAVIYIVCLSPMPIAHALNTNPNMAKVYSFQVYCVVGNNLEVLNAALNFYMYCLASRMFREALREFFRDVANGCRRIKSPNNHNNHRRLEMTQTNTTKLTVASPPTVRLTTATTPTPDVNNGDISSNNPAEVTFNETTKMSSSPEHKADVRTVTSHSADDNQETQEQEVLVNDNDDTQL